MSDNRAKLLHIALKLFAAHGYDAVGVQQIVEEAELTKPTLYHYFQSKRGVFEALVEQQSAALFVELRQASHYQHDITLSITNVLRCYFQFLRTNPTFYRLMLVTSFVPPSSEIFPVIADLHEKQYALIEQMFLHATADHGNMRGRHKHYAVSLRGLIDTYVGLSLQGYIQLDAPDTLYKIVHQFMHGIFS